METPPGREPVRLLDGLAPPARGLPVLVVKGRERLPSSRGGLPAPPNLRPGPPVGLALLGGAKLGRSKLRRSGLARSGLGRSGLGRSVRGGNWPGRLEERPAPDLSEPAPRNGGRPAVGRPVGGRLEVERMEDSRSGSTASMCSFDGLGGFGPSFSVKRRGPAWGLSAGRSASTFFQGFLSKGRPPSGRRVPANPPPGRP